ncbi:MULTISPECIES: DUF680 domain-containing protein [unclassified Mesorhizobium]|uniref:DUF680 domain-containing protein n=1 Tax=unclassified Mesorhizobium TaxID=325217 RepID=UPI000BAFE9F1|nr:MULTISPECIES: DUF680 domain-containing protein [unclassified Mesorhizobium]TGT61134.1 DUF680 domain-containing protein [Mesorhizobium sp. M00.F.Ca.ET.170.01.1.1]AZO08903.1 DUF680 domain-containing protein [Mesorhizobium sp. M3A.F.Ca.ET.080.04.2.1]PBB84232.1 hypothetical protein CK216_24430 [Mesorhizobium sp. WSM3876]RWB84628.1 MAG: DUF680 domain-containing protein [Mesorhizobium sp.]RWE26526.1 MAG: DUF680 domain-containing protein [Mesorhizobium sp.]
MNKIALTAAALLVATGSAFAGSDHYGSDNVNQPAVTQSARAGDNIDRGITGSIRKFEQRDLKISPDQNQPQSGRGIWGR